MLQKEEDAFTVKSRRIFMQEAYPRWVSHVLNRLGANWKITIETQGVSIAEYNNCPGDCDHKEETAVAAAGRH